MSATPEVCVEGETCTLIDETSYYTKPGGAGQHWHTLNTTSKTEANGQDVQNTDVERDIFYMSVLYSSRQLCSRGGPRGKRKTL